LARLSSPSLLTPRRFSLVDAALSAQSAPPLEAHSEDKSIDSFLRPIARKLHRHTANLERLNAQLGRGIAQRDAQLEVVRAALDQEIKKRLLAEQELTQANLRLKDQVVHDGLTGLHNRRYLEESLGREESRARRSALPFGVMMIDIDKSSASTTRSATRRGTRCCVQ